MSDSASFSPRRRSRWLVLLAGIALASLLGEGMARLRYAHPALPPPEHAPAPPGMYEDDPSTGFRLAPGFVDDADRFSTNALGFRDRLRTPGPAPAGTLRVALIGDSFAAGVGVADDQHLSRLLEDALVASGQAVQVWNLGVPHFGTQQSMLQLMDRWDSIQPDVVVLALFEGNDAFDDIQGPSFHTVRNRRITRRGWAPWPGDPYNDERAELNRPLLAHHLPLDGVLQRRSALYRLLLRGLHAAQYDSVRRWPWGMEPFDYEAFGGVAWLYLAPPPPPIEGGWRITADVLGELKHRVGKAGPQLAVLAIPSKIMVVREDLRMAFEEGWELGYRPGGGALDGSREFDVEIPTQRVVELTDTIGIPRIDLVIPMGRAAEQERLYYLDDSHWNAAGHRVAAGELGRGLARLGWIEEPVGLLSRLEAAVPIGSAPEEYEAGFRAGRAGPGPRLDALPTPLAR